MSPAESLRDRAGDGLRERVLCVNAFGPGCRAGLRRPRHSCACDSSRRGRVRLGPSISRNVGPRETVRVVALRGSHIPVLPRRRLSRQPPRAVEHSPSVLLFGIAGSSGLPTCWIIYSSIFFICQFVVFLVGVGDILSPKLTTFEY